MGHSALVLPLHTPSGPSGLSGERQRWPRVTPGHCVLQQGTGNWPAVPRQTVGSFVTGGNLGPSPSGRSSGLGLRHPFQGQRPWRRQPQASRVETQEWGEEDFPRSQARVALAVPPCPRRVEEVTGCTLGRQNIRMGGAGIRGDGAWEGPARTRKPWPLLALL